MAWDVDLAGVGALLAEPVRCRILTALLDGRALAASVLAAEAGVSPSTATAHLSRLVDAGWLDVEAHGRFRYYRLANSHVAELLESMAKLAPQPPVRSLAGEVRRRQLRNARTCYRHLAGRLGVALLAALLDREWVVGHDGTFRPGVDQLSRGGRDVTYHVTETGRNGLTELGIDIAAGAPARHCVDWSEQRHHLSGDVGRRLADGLFELTWIARTDRNRIVEVTANGAVGLRRLGVDISFVDDRAA